MGEDTLAAADFPLKEDANGHEILVLPKPDGRERHPLSAKPFEALCCYRARIIATEATEDP